MTKQEQAVKAAKELAKLEHHPNDFSIVEFIRKMMELDREERK